MLDLQENVLSSSQDLKERCRQYVQSRKSTYEFRCQRYRAVAQRLLLLKLSRSDSILDLGAGRAEFGHYLQQQYNWNGTYYPIDGSIDGTDLNSWIPAASFNTEYSIGIEILEHLANPARLMAILPAVSKKGIVFTTPNPETVDVIGCDPTHVSLITTRAFQRRGYTVKEVSLFNKPEDTLLAWKAS